MMTTEKSTLITSNDPKGIQATNLFHGVYNKLGLDEKRAQRLNENRESKFTEGLARLIMECSATDLFANQVVVSNYTYPGEFQRKPEELQIKILAEELKLDPRMALDYLRKIEGRPSVLPSGCHPQDGNIAIVSPFGLMQLIKGFKDPFDPELYCQGLLRLFEIISKERSFTNYRNGQIDSEHLRQTVRTLEACRMLANEQGESPIWIISAQLGFLHKGESTNRAREIFMPNEFGLGSVAGSSIAITHPERFVRNAELDMDLPGDEFSPDADGSFSRCPRFIFNDSKLEFDTYDVSNAVDRFGSASAFLPQ